MTDRYRELRESSAAVERSAEPQHVAKVISEVITLRGLARVYGRQELQQAWQAVAGEEIGRRSRVMELTRGVLQVSIGSSAMFQELAGFHKQSLLENLKNNFAHLKIREIKFKLKTDLK
jgi:predicted nucleic acid-binding Zn ribbon protein